MNCMKVYGYTKFERAKLADILHRADHIRRVSEDGETRIIITVLRKRKIILQKIA